MKLVITVKMVVFINVLRVNFKARHKTIGHQLSMVIWGLIIEIDIL